MLHKKGTSSYKTTQFPAIEHLWLIRIDKKCTASSGALILHHTVTLDMLIWWSISFTPSVTLFYNVKTKYRKHFKNDFCPILKTVFSSHSIYHLNTTFTVNTDMTVVLFRCWLMVTFNPNILDTYLYYLMISWCCSTSSSLNFLHFIITVQLSP